MHEGKDLNSGLGGDAEPSAFARRYYHDPWLIPKGGTPLGALAEEVFALIPEPPITPGRKHRRDATERRRLCAYNITANLAAMVLGHEAYSGMTVRFAKEPDSRYTKAPFPNAVLVSSCRALELLGLIYLTIGAHHRHSTIVHPTENFANRLRDSGTTLADIKATPGAETLFLRAERAEDSSKEQARAWVPYADNAHTAALRAEMEAVNAAINEADVRLDDRPIAPVRMVRIFQDNGAGKAVEWNRHGRLYHGTPWLDMPSRERHRLSMGGEQLADLDFRACFLHLASIKAGVPFPRGDPYSIEGLEHCRPQVKGLLSSLFFRPLDKPAKRLPHGYKAVMGEGWSMERFLEAVAEKHPGIPFNTNVGWELFFMESRVLLETMRRLREIGIVVLPAHDGLLVRLSHKLEAMTAMVAASRNVLGSSLPVVEKPLARPPSGLDQITIGLMG